VEETTRKSMRRRPLGATLPFAGVIVLGCGGLLLASTPVAGASNGLLTGSNRSTTKTMSLQISDPRSLSDAKSVKIFDNLARLPSGAYWGGAEIVIIGGTAGNSTFPDTQLAAAFTPSANHTATMIEVATVNANLGYGTSGFTLSLNLDANGVPGKALISASLPGLPNNAPGLCCALVIGTIPSGLALSGGTQYWIFLNGQGGQPSDLAAWDMNATDQLHPFLDAAYCSYASKCPKGPGWYPFQGTFLGSGAAFAVLGSS